MAGARKFFRRPDAGMCRDAGLALILIGLIAFQVAGSAWLIPALIATTLLVMVWPRAFFPFAVLWFALSEALGTVMSKGILTILFFTVVTPIGLVRRLLGADAMQTRAWKAGGVTAFKTCDHRVTGEDMEQLF